MAKRMSNKERIARMAAEKKAGKTERTVKKAAAKKTTAKKTTAKKTTAKKTTAKKTAKKKTAKKKTSPRKAAARRAVRMRRIWVVYDHAGNPVKTFAFNQEEEAKAEAARLTSGKGRQHWVSSGREPME